MQRSQEVEKDECEIKKTFSFELKQKKMERETNSYNLGHAKHTSLFFWFFFLLKLRLT
jgi:hypothetical protein